MNPISIREPSPPTLARVRQLSGKLGLVSRSVPLFPAEGEPQFSIQTSLLDDPSTVLRHQAQWSHASSHGNFDGAGGAIDPERSRDISIVESLERYSSCTWDDQELIFAAEVDLDPEVVRGPNSWPRCSDRELSDPTSMLVPYDPRLPIRWKRAWSLTHHKEVLVPATLVHLRFQCLSRSELFAHSVSTGTAAHHSLSEAVLGGLLEVVERDSIALTWLQRLRLPRVEVDVDSLPPEVRAYHDLGTSTNIEVRIFDATTDFGIPVLYAMQLADSDPVLNQIVAATCDLDPQRALAKIHREFASLRIALRSHARSEQDFNGVSVVGGAIHQAISTHRGVFNFFLDGPRSLRQLNEVGDRPQPRENSLSWAVSKLAAAGAEVIVTDLTTDEAHRVGFHVVKVLVPQAMPLSFVHGARYLATPRLYEAPQAMGHTVHDEQHLNHEYQPFA